MHTIDLSVPLSENTPVFPGSPKVKIETGATVEKDGYELHYIHAETHVGTHIDAPSHMIAGRKQLDEFSIEQFYGRGVYVNIIQSFDISAIKNTEITKDDIVIFNTGMDQKYIQPEYFTNNPQMSEELAMYLVSKKVKMVGIDACGVDRDPYPIHKILLKNNILLIENLTNVNLLKGKSFTITALPLNVHLDGSPARVIAHILE